MMLINPKRIQTPRVLLQDPRFIEITEVVAGCSWLISLPFPGYTIMKLLFLAPLCTFGFGKRMEEQPHSGDRDGKNLGRTTSATAGRDPGSHTEGAELDGVFKIFSSKLALLFCTACICL